MLTRRQFGVGAVAAAGVIGVGLPASSASSGVAPLPVHALHCCNDLVQCNARRLERLALEVSRIEPFIETDRSAAQQWPRLYEAMVDEAWGLREKGIMGWSPPERELLDWVSTIYPDAETRARQPRVPVSGLSDAYERWHRELEGHLFDMAHCASCVRNSSDDHSEATLNAALRDLARSEATSLAWHIVGLVPECRADVEAHRLAVEVLYSTDDVFERRYSIRYREGLDLWPA